MTRDAHGGIDARVQQFWDDLSDFGPACTDSILEHTLATVCDLINAQAGFWLGSVRMGDPSGQDPLFGWRPAAMSGMHPDPAEDPRFRDHCRRIEGGAVDPGIIANVRHAGTFRINIKHELVSPEWFESEFYREFFRGKGVQDFIFVVSPLGDEVESWFCFQRIGQSDPFFGERERVMLETVFRPLRWLHQRIALHYGVGLATRPLTNAERRVLPALLSDRTAEQIGRELALSPASINTYCTRIARKFNVRGRAGLMALWLGTSVSPGNAGGD